MDSFFENLRTFAISQDWPNIDFIWNTFFKEENPCPIETPLYEEYDKVNRETITELQAIKQKLSEISESDAKVELAEACGKLKKKEKETNFLARELQKALGQKENQKKPELHCLENCLKKPTFDYLQDFFGLPFPLSAALFSTNYPVFNLGNLLIWRLIIEVDTKRTKITSQIPIILQSWETVQELFSELSVLAMKLTVLLEKEPYFLPEVVNAMTHKKIVLKLNLLFGDEFSYYHGTGFDIDNSISERLLRNHLESLVALTKGLDDIVQALQKEAQLLKQIRQDHNNVVRLKALKNLKKWLSDHDINLSNDYL